MNTPDDALREAANIPPHILADSIEESAHTIGPSRRVKVSKQEQQAQAVEPKVHHTINGEEFITLQSHREAMAKAVKMLSDQDYDYNRKTNGLIKRHADRIVEFQEALAKKDAAEAKLFTHSHGIGKDQA